VLGDHISLTLERPRVLDLAVKCMPLIVADFGLEALLGFVHGTLVLLGRGFESPHAKILRLAEILAHAGYLSLTVLKPGSDLKESEIRFLQIFLQGFEDADYWFHGWQLCAMAPAARQVCN
jgi:hypothetical protein